MEKSFLLLAPISFSMHELPENIMPPSPLSNLGIKKETKYKLILGKGRGGKRRQGKAREGKGRQEEREKEKKNEERQGRARQGKAKTL